MFAAGTDCFFWPFFSPIDNIFITLFTGFLFGISHLRWCSKTALTTSCLVSQLRMPVCLSSTWKSSSGTCCCWHYLGFSCHSKLLSEAVLLHLTLTSTSGTCCSIVHLKCKRSLVCSSVPWAVPQNRMLSASTGTPLFFWSLVFNVVS